MIPTSVYTLLKDCLPMVILFSIVMTSLSIVKHIYSKEKINWRKEIKFLIYIIYCFCLFVFVTSTDFESYSNNFIPFKEIMRYSISSNLWFRNVIGNILIFLPFGYLITDDIQTKVKKCNIFVAWIVCLITSLSIELIQMFIGRSFDIDDIILNMAGGTLGYIIYKLAHVILNKVRKKYDNNLFIELLSFGILLICLAGILIICYEVVIHE